MQKRSFLVEAETACFEAGLHCMRVVSQLNLGTQQRLQDGETQASSCNGGGLCTILTPAFFITLGDVTSVML